MSILTNTPTSHISMHARVHECFHANKVYAQKNVWSYYRPVDKQMYVCVQTPVIFVQKGKKEERKKERNIREL